MFSYDEWVSEQTEKVRSAVNRLAMSGIYEGAVHVMPSNGATQGELIVCTEPCVLPVLAFRQYGTRVAAVPSSHLWKFIWEVCRHEPICPTE
jgi:hypothetical protein